MAELKHKKCGGVISVDIANMYALRTHSIIITPQEVKLGVLELAPLRTTGQMASLICNSCEERFAIDEEGLEEIVAMCLVCSHKKPASELYVSFSFPLVCSSCKDVLSGTGKPSAKKEELTKYFSLKGSTIEFKPLVDILKKPIS